MIAPRHGPTTTCAALAAGALLAAACGGARVARAPAPSDRGCTVAGERPSSDSGSVVVTWAVDPRNAPRATNPGERFVFDLGYETLVRLDCLGRVMPALASSWTAVEGGMRLHLTLRDSARFWNGDPVTAGDVIASWRAAGYARLAAAAVALSGRVLQVDCAVLAPAHSGNCPVLAALGHAELAVARRSPGSVWPDGTGPYRIRESAPAGAVRARRPALTLDPLRGGDLPRLTVHSVADADARDLIDAGIHLMLTEDPALATYALARSELAPLVLPWDRTWALVTPARRTPVGPGEPPPGLDPDSIALRTRAARVTLARDVVRAEARAAEGPYWWGDLTACTASGAAGNSPSEQVQSRLTARSDQPVARALAERLVALAAMGRGGSDSLLTVLAPLGFALGPRSTAISLTPNDFAASLRSGTEVAYVVALPRYSVDPCVDAERVIAAAPWLARDLSRHGSLVTLVPLVETRLRAVVRRDWPGLTMTWDSTITISSR